MIDTVKEKQTSILRLTFKDENGDLITPSDGSYTIYDVYSGTEVKATTNFTPLSSTHDLTITSSENAIVDKSKAYELRMVTVTFTYSGKTGNDFYYYKVQNLAKVV